MNKIITIPANPGTRSCSSNQIKTSEAPIQTPFISQPASPPKARFGSSYNYLPKPDNKSRHHSIIELSGNSFAQRKSTDKAEESAQQEKVGCLESPVI